MFSKSEVTLTQLEQVSEKKFWKKKFPQEI